MPTGNSFVITQDYETVIIRGKGKNIEAEQRRNVVTETRAKYDGTKSAQNRKLDEATDGGKPLRINPKIKDAIIKGRSSQKITQKDLAKRAQVQPHIIQGYENGKLKADVNILRKLERILKVKLTGKEFNGINV